MEFRNAAPLTALRRQESQTGASRRSTLPATAAALAAEFKPSTRTVNRAIADLMARRVPITGEAGRGDPLLPCVARDVVAKIVAVVPEYHSS